MLKLTPDIFNSVRNWQHGETNDSLFSTGPQHKTAWRYEQQGDN